MRRLSAFILHATAAGVMTWGWLRSLELTRDWPMVAQKGGHFQFLTIQGLVAAWSCMIASLFRDMFPSAAVFRRVKRALWMIAMHMALVVSSYYWPVLLFRPYLILRPTADSHLPLPIDLAVHASPLFALLIDFFASEPKFSKECVHKAVPAAVVASSVWYASFVEYCATFNGSFPYPFLTYNPFMVRVLIYITTAGLGMGCIRMFNALHG